MRSLETLSGIGVALMLVLLASQAQAGKCQDTARDRTSTGDTTRVITHIVNGTSSPQMVQFGTQTRNPGVHKSDVQTLQPGQTATLSRKVGSAGNVLFVMYVKQQLTNADSTTSLKEILKCRYVVDNLKTGAASFWKKWSCPTTSPTLGQTCEKTWKPGKKQWVTTLTLK